MGSAGGEGEVHSPSSMKVSATMPSKGARRTVLSSCAWARRTADSARSAAARAARQAASAARASLATRSRRSGETIPSADRLAVRSRSRPARSAAKQAWSRWARAALRSSPERRSCARWRASSTRRSRSPLWTRAPRRRGSSSTRPPISGASLARRRAFTVPAREFVTVSSTRPFSTATTRTGTGSGAKTVSRRRTTSGHDDGEKREANPEATRSHAASLRPFSPKGRPQPRGVTGGGAPRFKGSWTRRELRCWPVPGGWITTPCHPESERPVPRDPPSTALRLRILRRPTRTVLLRMTSHCSRRPAFRGSCLGSRSLGVPLGGGRRGCYWLSRQLCSTSM